MLAFCFEPDGAMEERNGWQRAIMAAQKYDVTVLYWPKRHSVQTLQESIPADIPYSALQFVPIHEDWLCRSLMRRDCLFYYGYRHWQSLAYRKAKALHQQKPFDLAHFVTLCGFREPGYLWKLGIPHVWGPLGGTHYFPRKFLSTINFANRVRELCRSAINYYQLNWCARIHRAARCSSIVIGATSSARRSLSKGLQVPVSVELETGIDYRLSELRRPRSASEPLRILWSGRLREWKGLPLLLEAISRLPRECPVQLRIMGAGSSEREWKQLSQKLGIDSLIEWVAWPTYRETMAHYEWADVFAFTSLRDTSGTGLLEALAAGCPIIGLNHQGAADIMTPNCALPVSVDDVETTICEFSSAIQRIASDVQLWTRLSHGALARAAAFQWKNRSDWLFATYEKAMHTAKS
jgi:glycosyltransferase involved in cell wall biosynthesis